MTPARQGSLKSLARGNRDQLIALLREHGALHRAELARRSGLSRTTVSNIVGKLLDEELVVEYAGNGTGGPAHGAAEKPRSGLLTLNPAAGAALGIDLSFTRVRVVAADLAHRILGSTSAPLAAELGWAERLDIGVELADRILGDAGVDRSRVIGTGLGVQGTVDLTSGEIGRSSKSIWHGVDAADELRQRFGTPVSIDNTGHLGSLGEYAWGAARGCRNMMYVKLSTGVAAGFVIDGRVFRGSVGAAGEIGHITIDEAGPACACGSRGCLETYVGIPAILDTLRPALGDLSVDDVIGLTQDGNRTCLRVIGDAGHVLGRTLASICNLLNPERIVIGGELATAGEPLLNAITDVIRRNALEVASNTVEVVPGELGDNAGALGGVALVLRDGAQLARAAV